MLALSNTIKSIVRQNFAPSIVASFTQEDRYQTIRHADNETVRQIKLLLNILFDLNNLLDSQQRYTLKNINAAQNLRVTLKQALRELNLSLLENFFASSTGLLKNGADHFGAVFTHLNAASQYISSANIKHAILEFQQLNQSLDNFRHDESAHNPAQGGEDPTTETVADTNNNTTAEGVAIITEILKFSQQHLRDSNQTTGLTTVESAISLADEVSAAYNANSQVTLLWRLYRVFAREHRNLYQLIAQHDQYTLATLTGAGAAGISETVQHLNQLLRQLHCGLAAAEVELGLKPGTLYDPLAPYVQFNNNLYEMLQLDIDEIDSSTYARARCLHLFPRYQQVSNNHQQQLQAHEHLHSLQQQLQTLLENPMRAFSEAGTQQLLNELLESVTDETAKLVLEEKLTQAFTLANQPSSSFIVNAASNIAAFALTLFPIDNSTTAKLTGYASLPLTDVINALDADLATRLAQSAKTLSITQAQRTILEYTLVTAYPEFLAQDTDTTLVTTLIPQDTPVSNSAPTTETALSTNSSNPAETNTFSQQLSHYLCLKSRHQKKANYQTDLARYQLQLEQLKENYSDTLNDLDSLDTLGTILNALPLSDADRILLHGQLTTAFHTAQRSRVDETNLSAFNNGVVAFFSSMFSSNATATLAGYAAAPLQNVISRLSREVHTALHQNQNACAQAEQTQQLALSNLQQQYPTRLEAITAAEAEPMMPHATPSSACSAHLRRIKSAKDVLQHLRHTVLTQADSFLISKARASLPPQGNQYSTSPLLPNDLSSVQALKSLLNLLLETEHLLDECYLPAANEEEVSMDLLLEPNIIKLINAGADLFEDANHARRAYQAYQRVQQAVDSLLTAYPPQYLATLLQELDLNALQIPRITEQLQQFGFDLSFLNEAYEAADAPETTAEIIAVTLEPPHDEPETQENLWESASDTHAVIRHQLESASDNLRTVVAQTTPITEQLTAQTSDNDFLRLTLTQARRQLAAYEMDPALPAETYLMLAGIISFGERLQHHGGSIIPVRQAQSALNAINSLVIEDEQIEALNARRAAYHNQPQAPLPEAPEDMAAQLLRIFNNDHIYNALQSTHALLPTAYALGYRFATENGLKFDRVLQPIVETEKFLHETAFSCMIDLAEPANTRRTFNAARQIQQARANLDRLHHIANTTSAEAAQAAIKHCRVSERLNTLLRQYSGAEQQQINFYTQRLVAIDHKIDKREQKLALLEQLDDKVDVLETELEFNLSREALQQTLRQQAPQHQQEIKWLETTRKQMLNREAEFRAHLLDSQLELTNLNARREAKRILETEISHSEFARQCARNEFQRLRNKGVHSSGKLLLWNHLQVQLQHHQETLQAQLGRELSESEVLEITEQTELSTQQLLQNWSRQPVGRNVTVFETPMLSSWRVGNVLSYLAKITWFYCLRQTVREEQSTLTYLRHRNNPFGFFKRRATSADVAANLVAQNANTLRRP
jgi:hypothetical protein